MICMQKAGMMTASMRHWQIKQIWMPFSTDIVVSTLKCRNKDAILNSMKTNEKLELVEVFYV